MYQSLLEFQSFLESVKQCVCVCVGGGDRREREMEWGREGGEELDRVLSKCH